MKTNSTYFYMFFFLILLIIPEQFFAREYWPREGQTVTVSKMFVDAFNNTYNLKSKKLVFKADVYNCEISKLNIDAKWASGVRINCQTHQCTVGVIFYDKIKNSHLYSAERYSIYKLPKLQNDVQLIAVFYLLCPDRLIDEILQKDTLSNIFTCVQTRQKKEIYYLLKPFLHHIEYQK